MSVTTVERLPAILPALRLLPVPVSEPPYDDDLAVPQPVIPAARRPLGPLCLLTPPLRLVPDLADDEEDVRPRTPISELPSSRPVARALVQGLLEVLAGVRPLVQLQRDTSTELYAQLEQLLRYRPRASGNRPRTGAVRSLHIQERPDGVAEVCATVHRGHRTAAIALRLEGIAGRWCCTDLVGL